MKITLTCVLALFSLITFSQVFSPAPAISVSDTFGYYHPQIEISNDGVPVVIWTDQNDKDLYFARHNGVDDFMAPVKLNPDGTDVQAYTWSGANMAIEGDNIYVVYHSDGFETGHCYLVKSTDNGATWSDTIRIDFVADGYAQFPDVTAYNDTLWVVILDHDAGGLDPQYRVTRSPDGGNTWEADVQCAAIWPGESCDCCSPDIVANDKYVTVFSRNNNSNIREFKAVVSYDRGDTFTGMLDIDNHAWNIMTCPSVGPDARMITQDEVIVVYRTEHMGVASMYLHHYDLQGDSTITEVDVKAGPTFNNTLVSYPQLDFDPVENRIALVWESIDDGIDVFLNTTINGPSGLITTTAINLTNANGTQSKPDIKVRGGKYHIVYMDTDGFDVKYVQVTESAAGFDNENGLEAIVYPNPANDEVNVVFENGNTESTTVEILNVQGQIVFKTETTANAVQIKTGFLSPGAYIYQITNARTTSNGMLIIE